MADIRPMQDEQAPTAPNPAATAGIILGCVVAVETVVLAGMLIFLGPAVLLLGAMAEFFIWGATTGTRSKTTVIVVGILAVAFLPLIALMLLAGTLANA